MRSGRWMWLTVGVAALTTGCGVPIQSGAHFANGWEPGRLRTFAWHEEEQYVQGDARLEGNTFFLARLREAVEWELNLRGIRYAQDGALHVHHHLSLADHVLEREVIDEAGYRGSESEVYRGGSIVVHLVDVATGQDVWVAWAQANIEPALYSPDAMRGWVYSMVREMFEEWPVPEGAPGS